MVNRLLEDSCHNSKKIDGVLDGKIVREREREREGEKYRN